MVCQRDLWQAPGGEPDEGYCACEGTEYRVTSEWMKPRQDPGTTTCNIVCKKICLKHGDKWDQKGDMMDTAQHIVTQVAQGDFAAVEQRLADLLKPLLPVEAPRSIFYGKG